MPHDVLQLVASLLWECLIGGLIIVAGVCLGWAQAGRTGRWTVRLVASWVDGVVRPLLASRSWAWRAIVIALNNSLVCAIIVGLGALPPCNWFGLAIVGVSLGIGLRLLLVSVSDAPEPSRRPARRHRWVGGIGFALNMLEPPAILLAAGLSLTQGAWTEKATPTAAWVAFACVVLPLLVIAAAGESLWMGVFPVAVCEKDRGKPEDEDDA
jgi:hypothetical protein